MRRVVKVVLGWLALATGLYRLLLRDKAIIVLFHRVDDGLEDDSISCSRDAFRSFCDFFRRHFRVVSLEQLIVKLRQGEDISRHLVITFDDGYRDNAAVAAPELSRRGLPACFFIATHFIGSDRQAPWDAENGVVSHWMTWDDVRELHRQGFEVGAHTMHHVDLGRVAREEAAREIAGSRQRLEQELGTDVLLFSYPFGRSDNITEENRAEVRNAGFLCCPSAFGGLNTRLTDPYYLRRVPINSWYLSPYQFLLEVIRQGHNGANFVTPS